MRPDNDSLALDALAWAFSGQRSMPASQHRQVKAAMRQAKAENYETPGKRRSRFWGLGPSWGRRAA